MTYNYSNEVQAIHDAYGISVALTDTSGGNYVLMGALESGHVIVIGDPADSLSTSEYRDDIARDGGTVGYGVSIHEPTDNGMVYGDSVASVSDDDGETAADLVQLIGRALAELIRIT